MLEGFEVGVLEGCRLGWNVGCDEGMLDGFETG
jgi:hypothetical protein